MQNHYPTQIEAENSPSAGPLVERMDPAIGEATSVMGAMLTELLRRTLRGGVMKIGNELQAYVAEQVDSTISERTPAIEQAAAEVAEHTARSAATEVAKEEVQALEQKTAQASQELSERIETTSQTVHQRIEETATTVTRDLTSRIEETQRNARESTLETARQLASQIEEAEKRVADATHAEISQQIQTLVQRSREGTDRLKAKLTALDQAIADGTRQQEALRHEFVRMLEDSQKPLRAEIAQVLQTQNDLLTRVAELEKPRGLRALFARLFRRRKS